jgi:hypothetical protein
MRKGIRGVNQLFSIPVRFDPCPASIGSRLSWPLVDSRRAIGALFQIGKRAVETRADLVGFEQ